MSVGKVEGRTGMKERKDVSAGELREERKEGGKERKGTDRIIMQPEI